MLVSSLQPSNPPQRELLLPALRSRQGAAGPRRHRECGLTLIELVMFIVIVSVALAAMVGLFAQVTGRSADPMLRRQALAIAESLLEEVQLMPCTYCDPDDAGVDTANSSAACASLPELMGPEAGENRFATPQFDNVNDYNGYAMTPATTGGIKDITNTAIAGLSGYSARIAVAAAALGPAGAPISASSGDALLITVTVTDPGGGVITLAGYRSRHAPNAAL